MDDQLETVEQEQLEDRQSVAVEGAPVNTTKPEEATPKEREAFHEDAEIDAFLCKERAAFDIIKGNAHITEHHIAK